jgi:hypothetical protein
MDDVLISVLRSDDIPKAACGHNVVEREVIVERNWTKILTAAVVLLIAACEPGGSLPKDNGPADTDSGSAGDADGDGDTDTDTEFDECAGISEGAQNQVAPVDIIFLVDTSASMMEEALGVRANLNAFSQQIIDAGIDVRIVMIGETGGWLGNPMIYVCIEPPLGAGNCPAGPDTNLPTYLHITEDVGSSDSLQVFLDTYDLWSMQLREDSVRNIVVVSDDNSAMTGADFQDALADLSPSFDSFVFHGIVSATDCPPAASVGQVYIDLIEETGGVLGDLCLQEFAPVFDEISTAVSQVAISCSWLIPDPPDGEVFDPELVNMEIEIDDEVMQIGYVDDPELCDLVEHGWYYDDPDNPTEIFVCPQTCELFQEAIDSAEVHIVFGCETIPAEIE